MKLSPLLAAALALGSVPFGAQAAAPWEAETGGDAPVSANLPPIYAAELERARAFVDGMMAEGVVVPIPADPGGGYTHEQHKRNYRALYLAGQLFRITRDERYADYARQMLLAYANLYPTLSDHPAKRNQHPGRLFWQVLNDAVWLVHAVQGYGEIRGTLSAADRARIDEDVFRRAVTFLSVDSQKTFDRIHNHATWATAGVGMTGYLLGDADMVERALKGSDQSGRAGFLRQTELLFSPDGYYNEGPYYQRYALMPFMVFAEAIERNDPDRRIFEHRDGVLLKALRATVQLTYDGYLFPFNDAIRDKSLKTDELYHGVAIAYAQTGDPTLLSIADFQQRTVLSDSGLKLAHDLAEGKAEPFAFRSKLFGDGADGTQGALAVLRKGKAPDHAALVAKNTSQGLGHGHFDKLGWQFYDRGQEVIRDYGAARFLNIEAKAGGRYLPENTSWAKSTIAHNTIAVDERSHFDGKVKIGNAYWPTQLYFSDDADLPVSSAQIDTAYAGVTLRRTLLMPAIEGLEEPLVIDLAEAVSKAAHLYDLPLHYSGHIIEHDLAVQSYISERPVLGQSNGYQHIWVDAEGPTKDGKGALTWILDGRFYTYRFAVDGEAKAVLGESGANDPNFNLRREPLIMLRAERESGGVVFASLLEAHGEYDGAAERTVASRSRVADLSHNRVAGNDIIRVTLKTGARYAVAVSHKPDPEARHSVAIDGDTIAWAGFAGVVALRGEGE